MPHTAVPDAAIASVLVSDPSSTVFERLGVTADRVPPAVFERASRARGRLEQQDRLVGGPTDIGLVYEALLASEDRRAGAHYTPPAVARALVSAALSETVFDPTQMRLWDPTCGGGAFLLAGADLLSDRGADPRRLLQEQLLGTDLDPGAVFITASALHRWGRDRGVDVRPERLWRGDSLLDPAAAPEQPVQLVIGNPPFHGQLSGTNVRDRQQIEELRGRFADLVGAYTDTAALFMAVGVQHLDIGGRCALVQPLSVLAARDTTAIRRWLEETAPLTGLWIAGEPVFDAAVQVCAPILQRRDGPPRLHRPDPRGRTRVRRWRGARVEEVEDGVHDESGSPDRSPKVTDTVSIEHRWSAASLLVMGVPDPGFSSAGILGDEAKSLAGFRDEYYGLTDHVIEGPTDLEPGDPDWPRDLAPLLTVGLIDPGTDLWGTRPVTFARRRLDRPVVDLVALHRAGGAASRWARRIAAPKVVVATQTRVGEAVVDPTGCRIASTPAVVVLADSGRLWELAAVICSPLASVAALSRTAGTGRSATSIRHSTRSVSELPLPVDHDAWRCGADALARNDRRAFLAAMASAYDIPETDASALDSWWNDNAP